MKNRWLWVLLGVIGFCAVLFAGAAAGAGVTYLALKAQPVEAASEFVLGAIDLNKDDYEPGVVVIHVDPEGPAAEAGIERGDIILAVDNQQVDTMLDIMQEIEEKSAGDELILTVQHCETSKEVSVELSEQNGHVYLGLQLSRMPIIDTMPPMRGSFITPVDQTAFVITQVTPGSPADDAGLEVGALIIGVNGKELLAEDDLAEIVQNYQPGDELTLELHRPRLDQSEQVSITLGENPEDPGRAYLGISYVTIPGFHSELPGQDRNPRFRYPDLHEDFQALPDTIPEFMPQWHDFPALPEGVEQAVLIRSISEDSPAELAGLEAGDVISEVDGDPFPDPAGFAEVIQGYAPGDEIKLTVYRIGEAEALAIDVVLGEHPDVDGQAYLGITIGGFLRFEGNPPFHKYHSPFHFEFHFPWSDDINPGFEGLLTPGDEA